MSLLYEALQKAESDRAGTSGHATAREAPVATATLGSRLLRLAVAAGMSYVGTLMIISVCGGQGPSRGEVIEWAIGKGRSAVATEISPVSEVDAPRQATDAAGAPAPERASTERVTTALDAEAIAPTEAESAATVEAARAPERVAGLEPPGSRDRASAATPARAPEPSSAAAAARAPELVAAPANPAVALAAPPSGAGGFSVQLGAFRSRDNALRLHARLAATHEAALDTPPSEAGFWIVRVGRYADREAATTAMRGLAREGFSGLVVPAAD